MRKIKDILDDLGIDKESLEKNGGFPIPPMTYETAFEAVWLTEENDPS